MSRLIIVPIIIGTLWGSSVYYDLFFDNWYIDDVTQTELMPSLLTLFSNRIYGDLFTDLTADGGIVFGKEDLKACGLFLDSSPLLGFGRIFSQLRFGLLYGPKLRSGHHLFGIGIGKDGFNRDIDFAFRLKLPDEGYLIESDARLRYRRRQTIIIPRISFGLRNDAFDYWWINCGIGLRKSVYEEGFLYTAIEYEPWFGDITTDHLIFQLGFDLPVLRHLNFLTAVKKSIDYRDEWIGQPVELNLGLKFTYDELRFSLGIRKGLFTSDIFETFPFLNLGIEYDFSNL